MYDEKYEQAVEAFDECNRTLADYHNDSLQKDECNI